MNKTLHILFLSLLTAVCLGFAVCSDCGDDLYGGTANDYEINDYYTSLLRQDWNGESTRPQQQTICALASSTV